MTYDTKQFRKARFDLTKRGDIRGYEPIRGIKSTEFEGKTPSIVVGEYNYFEYE